MENYLEKGVNEEKNGNLYMAVKCYIEAINQIKKPEKDVFANLAFILWEISTEPGVSLEFKIPKHEFNLSYKDILNSGLKIYPNDLELNFWKIYMNNREIGTELSEQQCSTILNKYYKDSSIIPYFYLFLINRNKYSHQANQLLQESLKHYTRKWKYIRSILESGSGMSNVSNVT